MVTIEKNLVATLALRVSADELLPSDPIDRARWISAHGPVSVGADGSIEVLLRHDIVELAAGGANVLPNGTVTVDLDPSSDAPAAVLGSELLASYRRAHADGRDLDSAGVADAIARARNINAFFARRAAAALVDKPVKKGK